MSLLVQKEVLENCIWRFWLHSFFMNLMISLVFKVKHTQMFFQSIC